MKNVKAVACAQKPEAEYYIAVRDEGLSLVYGQPPMTRQFVRPDRSGSNWTFDKGVNYAIGDNRLDCDTVGSRQAGTRAVMKFAGPYAGQKK